MISIYKDFKAFQPIENISMEDYITFTKQGRWRKPSEDARAALDIFGKGKEYDTAKSGSELLTISAGFETRRKEGFPFKHSGYILMDIDVQDNKIEDIEAFEESAMFDDYIYAYHKSIGGKGVAIIFKINPNEHEEAFAALSGYLKITYGLIADKQCGDITRGRFGSFDADIFHNVEADTFEKEILKKFTPHIQKSSKPTQKQATEFKTPELSNILEIAKEMVAKCPNIIDTYDDFIRMGFALVGGLGESGREVFHTVCSGHPSYSQADADEKYDECIRTYTGKSSMGTFYFYAKKAGVKVLGQKTPIKLKGRSTKETVVYMKDFCDNLGKRPNADQSYVLIKMYTDSLGLRVNEITQRTEYKGKDLPDAFEELIAGKLREVLPPSVVQVQRIREIVAATTDRYNPLKDYLEEIGNKPSQGVLDEVLDCIVLGENSSEDIKVMIRKWLVSLVGTVYGAKPELVIVFSGAQGCGKSTFFDHLLPESIRGKFYATGTYEQGGRGNELTLKMQEKLLYVNDEMAGMRHSDWKKFKALASMQSSFERPAYAKRAVNIKRLSVLGGATNDFNYMSDETGNRRIIPVDLAKLKYHKYLGIDKEALFSELVSEYLADPDFSWRLTPEEQQELKIVSEAYRFEFDYEVYIKENFRPLCDETKERNYYFLPATQLIKVISTVQPSINKYQASHIGAVLGRLGFDKKTLRINGTPVKGYLIDDFNGIVPLSSGVYGFNASEYSKELPQEMKIKQEQQKSTNKQSELGL